MQSVLDDTIGGFDSFCDEQKTAGEALGQETRMSLTLFDSTFELRYVAKDIADMPALTSANYRPGGNTALYDAIGANVRAVEELPDTPSKVLFVILTDGAENSSREWTRQGVFDLITQKREKDGWEFVFLGADQDAYAAGGSLGVGRTSSLSYRSADSRQAYEQLSRATQAWRSGQTRGVDIGVHAEDEEPDKSEGS